MVQQLDPDAAGPSPARTAEEFVAELRQLRARVGNPSFRQLGRIAEQRIAAAPDDSRREPLPPSTTSEVLSGKRLPRLPRLEFVESYVAACLRSSRLDEPAVAAEVARWREVWCSLATPEKLEEPARAECSPARRGLALPLVAVVFLAGIGVGVVGTRWWSGWRQPPAATAALGPSAEPADVCLAPGTANPTGQDVLGLPDKAQATGSWWVNKVDAATLRTDGRRFEADVAKGTMRPGDVLIVKSDVALVQGRPYALTFTALADRATTIRVRVQDSRPPEFHASYDREVSVTKSSCRHVYRFTAARTSTHSELTFQVGGHAENFRLKVSDVVLVAEST